MKTRLDVDRSKVQSHFTARAARYDNSSRWCTDRLLLEKIFTSLSPGPDDRVLDIACGTGLVAEAFRGRVRSIVGIDMNEAMFSQGLGHLDYLVNSIGEKLPFKNGVFAKTVERQGIQFMNAEAAVSEMSRVTSPGGRICLVQLCAYDQDDRDEYFEILRLRNPARRNFFTRNDLKTLLEEAGCTDILVHDFITEEDVDRWSDHGAIDELRREGIREVYRSASDGFTSRHAVGIGENGRIVDRMLFGIVVGVIP